MKITAISDQHGVLPYNLPEADVLTISGDICPVRESHNPQHQKNWINKKFIPYLDKLIKANKFKDILFVAGNHDYIFELIMKENKEDEFRASLPPHIHYLRDSEVTINGKRFYGTPWVTNLPNWAFNSMDEILNNIFVKIPTNIDVLLSHAPPYGFSDTILKPIYDSQYDLGHLGCKALTDHIKRAKPSYVFIGHIHTGNHNEEKILHDYNDLSKHTKVYNVSILDERYEIYDKGLSITI